MPYIITTTTRANVYGASGLVKANVPHEVSRTAVATLDEARESVANGLVEHIGSNGQIQRMVDTISESGGTIGPLPDGTVIEVRHAEWSTLARSCEPPLPIDGPNGREWTRLEKQAIIAGFNA